MRTTGKYIVTTYSGTKHEVDLDAKTSIRRAKPERAWTSDTDFGFGKVGPADGEPFHYDYIEGMEVGEVMVLLRDDGQWRRSSEIQTIAKVQKEKSGFQCRGSTLRGRTCDRDALLGSYYCEDCEKA